jgi:hypothetical protein
MTFLRRLLRAVIGEIHWSPPPWAVTAAAPLRAAADVRRRRPGRFWAATLACLLLVAGGIGVWRWIASRPKPAYLTVTVVNPDPTALEPADAKPNPLRIGFSES